MIEEHMVIYHASCMDGIASAWVAWKGLLAQGIPEEKITFLGCDYQDPVPPMADKVVYIVDFSWYHVEALLGKVAEAKRVMMIDHHAEANRIWKDVKIPMNMLYLHRQDLSGVGIAWEYFFTHQEMPLALKLVQDRDLWNFHLTGSRSLHAVLKARGCLKRAGSNEEILDQLKTFSYYASLQEDQLSSIIDEGALIERYENALIDLILERTMCLVKFPYYEPDPDKMNGDLVKVHEYIVPMAEMPYDLASEAGNKMAVGYPFSVTYETQHALGKRKFSIRSNKATGIKVGPIAVQNGGGGHDHSGGWYGDILETEDFPWEIVSSSDV